MSANLYTNTESLLPATANFSAQCGSLPEQTGDMHAHLASLDMVMTMQPFDETARAGIAEFINKPSPYDLTTQRYTESELARIEHDPDCFALQIRLADSAGDKGLVSVVICRLATDSTTAAWNIETWLMTCNVLGRRVEDAVLGVLCDEARRRGFGQLFGFYIPAASNALAEDHYDRLGFLPVDVRDDGSTVWQLLINNVAHKPLPIEVNLVSFESQEFFHA